ncbi:MAG: UDP-N-acetylmuramoyl-L-alanine--D-glutamate ligase [Pirellulales bacterium]|nr:UDP-N-acetylmuramoyl-L-alanine--D-glutamate ligase [Pirellulales bacterium]
MEFAGKRVTVMGLGHFGGGAAAVRWLATQGARVTLTDSAPAEMLADSLEGIADVPLAAVHLGGHVPEDFRQADGVVVNPAVRPDHPMLEIARQSGTRLTSELELFLWACPARTIGVTGSNGKSTTSAMIAAILEAAGRTVWLGGNIGRSLLDDLPRIQSNHDVVLEISSFQLHYLSDELPGPHVAVVTNFTPNHLDWHGNEEHYRASKQRILRLQSSGDVAVLGQTLINDGNWVQCGPADQISLPDPADLPTLRVPGSHNRENAQCAAAVALGLGISSEAIRRGLASFSGLPGRLKHMADVAGRAFFNDTTSTTPESTVAALAALDRPVWLLAGGRNKGLDLPAMAEAAAQHACGAAFFGQSAPLLQQLTQTHDPDARCTAVETLDEALAWCWTHSQPGDAILLSPGCASTDQYRNYKHRGAAFEAKVHTLKSNQT